jgi:hypothetical protein
MGMIAAFPIPKTNIANKNTKCSDGNLSLRIPPDVKFKFPVSNHIQKIAGRNKIKEVPTNIDK